MINRLTTLFSGLLLATGCTYIPQTSMDPDFGNAVKTNIAAQTIDPNAGQQDQPAAALDGQKSEQVLKNYRKEKGKVQRGKLIIDLGD